jgi:hypothetical protein
LLYNGNVGIKLNGSGNVGIGTTNPTERLTVNGNISATGTINGIIASDGFITSRTSVPGSIGIPGKNNFAIGPIVPPGAAFFAIFDELYFPVHLSSGSFM